MCRAISASTCLGTKEHAPVEFYGHTSRSGPFRSSRKACFERRDRRSNRALESPKMPVALVAVQKPANESASDIRRLQLRFSIP